MRKERTPIRPSARNETFASASGFWLGRIPLNAAPVVPSWLLPDSRHMRRMDSSSCASLRHRGNSFTFSDLTATSAAARWASGNPTARLKQLRSSSPCRLGFAFLATVENSAGAAVEREALGLLARHRTEGEWCRCPSQLAVAAVNWAAARQGLGLGAITDPAVADQSRGGGRSGSSL